MASPPRPTDTIGSNTFMLGARELARYAEGAAARGARPASTMLVAAALDTTRRRRPCRLGADADVGALGDLAGRRGEVGPLQLPFANAGERRSAERDLGRHRGERPESRSPGRWQRSPALRLFAVPPPEIALQPSERCRHSAGGWPPRRCRRRHPRPDHRASPVAAPTATTSSRSIAAPSRDRLEVGEARRGAADRGTHGAGLHPRDDGRAVRRRPRPRGSSPAALSVWSPDRAPLRRCARPTVCDGPTSRATRSSPSRRRRCRRPASGRRLARTGDGSTARRERRAGRAAGDTAARYCAVSAELRPRGDGAAVGATATCRWTGPRRRSAPRRVGREPGRRGGRRRGEGEEEEAGGEEEAHPCRR